MFGRGKLDKAVRRIGNNDPTLTEVELGGKSVGNAGAKKIAAALRHNATLTGLYLNRNSIGDEGGKAIAEALRHNATLTVLDLGNNSIGSEGGKALAEALRHNVTLTRLWLGGNSIGDEGGKALADALRQNTTLTWLSLNNNGIGGEGGKAIAEALRYNNTLTKLKLWNNSIGDDIMKKIERLIEINKNATSVQKAQRCKVAEFGPPASEHRRGEEDPQRKLKEEKNLREEEERRRRQAQVKADRDLAAELQKEEDEIDAATDGEGSNDAVFEGKEKQSAKVQGQETHAGTDGSADASNIESQFTSKPNATRNNQESISTPPYASHLTTEQLSAVSVLTDTLADYERSLQSVLGLPKSLGGAPPHVQAYFRLCTNAFERLYMAAQVLSTGAVKWRLMDNNMLGAVLESVGVGASQSNVSFLGCVSILTTLYNYQLQTKQNNGLWVFQEFLMGDSQNSYSITYRAAVEEICLTSDLSKFADQNVNDSEVEGLRSRIKEALKSVKARLRKGNLLDIRDVSPIELKVMEDLATVTRSILRLWTEQRDTYDVLKQASEDDKANFVLGTLGIARDSVLLPLNWQSSNGGDHKQRPKSMPPQSAKQPGPTVVLKPESLRFRALEGELQSVKEQLAHEKARAEDAKAETANVSKVESALQAVGELNKKIQRLERMIQANDNDDTIDVGVGGGQAQSLLSKRATKANMTPQERREQETLLTHLAEQNQAIRTEQSQLMELLKRGWVESFMANRLLNSREAKELIKCILAKSSADVAQSIALSAVVQSHAGIALDRNGCFELDGKRHKVGDVPRKWGTKALWKGDASIYSIKVDQDYNGAKSIRCWFEKNRLLHRYNLHVTSTILEVFGGEFVRTGDSNHPVATNNHGEKHLELKSELFDLGKAHQHVGNFDLR